MTVNLPQLRWILLLLGVAFLAGLAWWERRRPRQAQGGEPGMPGGGESALGTRVQREPTITFPEIRARDPLADLPAFEMVDESLILRASEDTPADGQARPPAIGAAPGTLAPLDDEPPLDYQASAYDHEPLLQSEPAPAPDHEPLLDREPLLKSEPLPDHEPVREVLLGPRGRPLAVPSGLREPIVDWPDPDSRRILALRLIAIEGRFAGHAVRQALAAEGFVLGKLDIFHRAGADGRAIVSAANLSKPGTFDRDCLDTQRFGGLSLFAVLPGPLPPVPAFDELLASARNLCDRLEGQLQDERGAALSAQRAAELRELAGGAVGHEGESG